LPVSVVGTAGIYMYTSLYLFVIETFYMLF
jgi:hypothetical protein